jgi:hypothetical protein
MREFLLFLVYSACTGYERKNNNSVSVLNRAQSLIAVISTSFLLIGILSLVGVTGIAHEFNGSYVLTILVVLFIVTYYMCTKVFSRKVLAKSLKKYRDHWICRFAKLITFSILFLSMAICSYVFVSLLK